MKKYASFKLFILLCCWWRYVRATKASIQPRRLVNFYDASRLLVNYHTGLQCQKSMMARMFELQTQPVGIVNGESIVGEVLVLQHNPVYTLGTGSNPKSGPFAEIDSKGNPLHFETVKVDRAGDATYHGPGQVVLYPVLDLNFFEKDINKYLRKLEQVVILTAKAFGIQARRKQEPGYTGVWVGDVKIAAIGLKISRWVTSHGVAINVDPDMRYFHNIVPCGIKDKDKSVGSLRQFNSELTVPVVTTELLKQLCCEFEITPACRVEGEVALQELQLTTIK